MAGGISWFLVCTIFNLCWGDNSQETQEKDCKRERGRNEDEPAWACPSLL